MASDNGTAGNGESPPPHTLRLVEPPAEFGLCGRCGQPLTRPDAAGGCLRCMIGLAVPDEDESLGAAGQQEERGYSHFEIALAEDGSLLELGHGAMGTTYCALDTVLQSPVALKVISKHVSVSPPVRARFLREARSAARLRHPNVASVFHYGEQNGECFYVMELVEGETLEARVRRDGPLPAETALEVGVQVARALAAAEAQRLVHRDIKPGNLMWVTSPQSDKPDGPPLIKVIDFGLAKVLTGDKDTSGESDTRHGFAGTPAYASPEQFARTEDLPVDTRSDLYSLGVTLWFLLCGRTPFRGNTLEEIHRQQTREPLPVDQLAARHVPAPVVALLRSLLTVDLRRRPQSVREFIELLERCRADLSPGTGRRGRRLWAATLVLLAFGVLVAFLSISARRGENHLLPLTTSDRSLAVLPFENRSPDPAEGFLAADTQDAITQNLARVKDLKVIGADSTRAYPSGPRDVSRIGRELGVRFLLEGSVRRQDGRMQVSARLVDARDSTRLWEKLYLNASPDVFPVYREITLDVTSRLQAVLSPDEKAAISHPPTTDPTAYDLYLRVCADPDLFADAAAWSEQLKNRVALLENAVAHDPRFMLAYCKLASIDSELAFQQTNVPPEQRTVDYRRLTLAALQRASDLQPDAGEVHLARADYLLRIEHDVSGAGAECELAWRALPNSADVEFVAGRVARRQGRWEDAVRCLERAATLEPRSVSILELLFGTYQALRRYADFDRTMLRMIACVPAQRTAEVALYRAEGMLEGNADLGSFRRLYAERAADDSLSNFVKEHTGLQIAVFNHDADALSRLLAASGSNPTDIRGILYPKAFFEGLAARMRGDAQGARAAFAKARPDLEKLVLAGPDSGRPLSILAIIDAGCGRNEDAVREARHACELMMPYEKFALEAPAARCNLATVYAWTGQPDLAFGELNAIVDKPAGTAFLLSQPTYGDFCLNPFWDPLRSDPRFAALVARLAPKPR